METTITAIETKIDMKTSKEYLVIRFLFDDKPRFTYLNEQAILYWANKGVKLSQDLIGTKINVKQVPREDNKIQYRIQQFI